jgi:hypothetical protein
MEHTKEMRTKFYSEKPTERHQRPEADGMIILKLVLRKQDVSVWTGFICLGAGIGVADSREYGNNLRRFIKSKKLLGQMTYYHFLKNTSP